MPGRLAMAALCAALFASPALSGGNESPLVEGETWADLRHDVVGAAPLLDGSSLFEVDAPYRAHDAAVVPVRITQLAASNQRVVKLTVIVDENPSPVAAQFEFGPSMGRIDIETRVRVDRYSNVRAIAQTEDGKLWMTGRFVKASGGCSAPASKDMAAAMSNVGKMRMRVFPAAVETEGVSGEQGGRPQAQVMMRHPNFSGLQRNQVTQLFIPAYFVDEMSVFLGGERLMRMTGGISISEDPTFRFSYSGNGAANFRVEATDTEGGMYGQSFAVAKDDSAS